MNVSDRSPFLTVCTNIPLTSLAVYWSILCVLRQSSNKTGLKMLKNGNETVWNEEWKTFTFTLQKLKINCPGLIKRPFQKQTNATMTAFTRVF
jgi:hypothetical protein